MRTIANHSVQLDYESESERKSFGFTFAIVVWFYALYRPNIFMETGEINLPFHY